MIVFAWFRTECPPALLRIWRTRPPLRRIASNGTRRNLDVILSNNSLAMRSSPHMGLLIAISAISFSHQQGDEDGHEGGISISKTDKRACNAKEPTCRV